MLEQNMIDTNMILLSLIIEILILQEAEKESLSGHTISAANGSQQKELV